MLHYALFYVARQAIKQQSPAEIALSGFWNIVLLLFNLFYKLGVGV